MKPDRHTLGDIFRTLLAFGIGVLLGMAIMEGKGSQHRIDSDRNENLLLPRK